MQISDTEYQLLCLLGVDERSGREIAANFQREFGHSISYGTLYTTLRRLRERGFVASCESDDEDGRVRYFTLLAEGRRALNKQQQVYSQLAAFGVAAGKQA